MKDFLTNRNWVVLVGGICVAIGSALTGQIDWPGAAMTIVALLINTRKS